MKLLLCLSHSTIPSFKHMLILVRSSSRNLILANTSPLKIRCLFKVYFRWMRLSWFHIARNLIIPQINHPSQVILSDVRMLHEMLKLSNISIHKLFFSSFFLLLLLILHVINRRICLINNTDYNKQIIVLLFRRQLNANLASALQNLGKFGNGQEEFAYRQMKQHQISD